MFLQLPHFLKQQIKTTTNAFTYFNIASVTSLPSYHATSLHEHARRLCQIRTYGCRTAKNTDAKNVVDRAWCSATYSIAIYSHLLLFIVPKKQPITMNTEKRTEILSLVEEIYQSNKAVIAQLLELLQPKDDAKVDTINALVETLQQNNIAARNAAKLCTPTSLSLNLDAFKFLIVVKEKYWLHTNVNWNSLTNSEQIRIKTETLNKIDEWLKNPLSSTINFPNYIDEISTEEEPLVKLIPINANVSYVAYT